ncbi:gamma-glutamyltransferase [filamentous cyanobacterium CCP5]|nr:gamma-glutamyltransferase [filamentous cyanobacterium CCP5]
MVSSPHYLASRVGLAILDRGGSAVDAAIATNAALGVVYPHMTGLGGDAFGLFYEARTGQVHGLNGSGGAAAAATIETYRQQGLQAIPRRGPLAAITIPGAVAAWAAAHGRFGRLSWDVILQPAIELATSGYPATESQCRWTRKDAPDLLHYSGQNQPFLPGGKLPEPGQTLTNPDLAQTLKQLAKTGADGFYRGPLGAAIARCSASLGGPLRASDLADYKPEWVEPISTTYRGHRVWELPPNCQGFTLLQMLNLIEPYDMQQIPHGSADYYHLLVEAVKLAFADRDRWLSDPRFIDIPLTKLISKDYAQTRSIDMAKAQTPQVGAIGGDTVYSAFVDAEGNAVSWIQSLYFDYGSTVVPSGTGFVLQNRGSFFSLDPHHPNCLEPGKRPFHTLMPALVTANDQRLRWVVGTMGGEGQPQTQLALITRMIDYGFDPQTAIDLPRWVWGRTWGDVSTSLKLEARVPETVRSELTARGHDVQLAPEWTDMMGHASAIAVDPVTEELQGGCDPRSDGEALGC